MVFIDCVSRLVPGVLGSAISVQDESFSNGLLEYPHYTRPQTYEGMSVPEVLLSGHHENIDRWRKKKVSKYLIKRPDLLKSAELTLEDIGTIERLKGSEE